MFHACRRSFQMHVNEMPRAFDFVDDHQKLLKMNVGTFSNFSENDALHIGSFIWTGLYFMSKWFEWSFAPIVYITKTEPIFFFQKIDWQWSFSRGNNRLHIDMRRKKRTGWSFIVIYDDCTFQNSCKINIRPVGVVLYTESISVCNKNELEILFCEIESNFEIADQYPK